LLHYFLFIIHVNTRGGSAASFDVRTMVWRRVAGYEVTDVSNEKLSFIFNVAAVHEECQRQGQTV
jgi:hypothetical protein